MFAFLLCKTGEVTDRHVEFHLAARYLNSLPSARSFLRRGTFSLLDYAIYDKRKQ